jgi:hypothetical protein
MQMSPEDIPMMTWKEYRESVTKRLRLMIEEDSDEEVLKLGGEKDDKENDRESFETAEQVME